jgi:hypothetical protein
MATAEGFPPELLSEPASARLAYFVGKVVAHPRLKEAHGALMSGLRRPGGASLILVLGPTGVGKTTLRLRVERQLTLEALPELERDPGRLPVVALEAVASEAGQFNWKDYYLRALTALEEPMARHKIDYSQRGEETAPPIAIRRDRVGQPETWRAAAPALRRALEQALVQRRPSAFIVDEAQHLGKIASGRRLLDQMDTLKSLSAMTGTVHVLIGTYELLRLADLSAQLSRRSTEIHFGRYRAESAEDLRAFRSVLLTFQRHLPLAVEPDLLGRYEYLYERSVGCVGVLKSWLNRALAAVLEEGGDRLGRRHLEGQAEPTRKLLSLAREIKEGEEALAGRDREGEELGVLLGTAVKAIRVGEPELGQQQGSGDGGSRRRVGRVGQRWPVRDPVGEGRQEHVG